MDPNQTPAPDAQPAQAPEVSPVVNAAPVPTVAPVDPSPAVAPVVVSAPEPVIPAAPQVVTAAYSPALVAPEAPKKSKKGLVFAIIGGAVLLVLMAVAALFFFAVLPAMQTAAFATGFMQNLTAGNVDAALVKAGGDQTYKTFLQTAATSLKGNTYSLKASSYKSGEPSNFLYTLQGGDKKYARVTVEKQNGKREVTGFVYSANELKLVASTSTSTPTTTGTTENTATETTPSTTTAATPSTACFDANSFIDMNPYPTEVSYDGRYVWYDNFFFKPDSSDYNYPDLMPENFAKYKKFYENNSSKQFTVQLSGTVYSASPATDLANARAQKAKADLVSQAGIPADRIVISEPDNSENPDNEAARNVDIKIQSPESCITVKN